ncbi:MAG TPA: hypothetical protein VMX74_15785, partial [Pirellulales bacterium]|nr:hypothetical protein [Pirellulales bacterium]
GGSVGGGGSAGAGGAAGVSGLGLAAILGSGVGGTEAATRASLAVVGVSSWMRSVVGPAAADPCFSEGGGGGGE